MVVGVSKWLQVWDQIPPRQGQCNYRCFEQKSNFITDYHSLKVTVRINEKVDRGNHMVGNRLVNSVNLSKWDSCGLSIRLFVCPIKVKSH